MAVLSLHLFYLDRLYNWTTISLIMVVGYFFLAGASYYYFYKLRVKKWYKKKVQPKKPSTSMVRLEILYSSITLLIYCGTSWIIYYCYGLGITKIYFEIEKFGWSYFLISIICSILIHDTYFYWTHRLIHLRYLFKFIHRTHHLSHNPTPWATFSFHPIEGIISVGYIPIIVFLIPIHPLSLFIFLSNMTLVSIVGHLGYEVFSIQFLKGNFGKWINSPTFHNKHHEIAKYNFGLYFTYWDRIMGTFKG